MPITNLRTLSLRALTAHQWKISSCYVRFMSDTPKESPIKAYNRERAAANRGQAANQVKKPSPIRKWNQEEQSKFWDKFDAFFQPKPERHIPSEERHKSFVFYLISSGLLLVAATYAAVPLYRMFCQQTGYGGTVQQGHDTEKVGNMKPNKERIITIKFNADTGAAMQWNFRPQQSEVKLYAGETALAFYTARNPTPKPIDGISTYNVVPFEAGQVI